MHIKFGFLKNTMCRLFVILISLGCALFLYLFYRTDHTLVNKIYISLMGYEHYISLKFWLQHKYHLNNWIVYSLPGGLWVFAATIVSKQYNIALFKMNFNVKFIPLIIVLFIEMTQLLKWNHGVFDVMDIIFGCGGWFAGLMVFNSQEYTNYKISILQLKSWFCIMTNAIVYLAHV